MADDSAGYGGGGGQWIATSSRGKSVPCNPKTLVEWPSTSLVVHLLNLCIIIIYLLIIESRLDL